MQQISVNDLEPGDVLSRSKGVAIHTGIYMGHGWQWQHKVFHLTPERGPHISSLEKFLDGNSLSEVEKVVSGAWPSILQRIQKELKTPAPYDLITNNCQHVTNRVAKGESSSGGVVFFSCLALASVVALAMRA